MAEFLLESAVVPREWNLVKSDTGRYKWSAVVSSGHSMSSEWSTYIFDENLCYVALHPVVSVVVVVLVHHHHVAVVTMVTTATTSAAACAVRASSSVGRNGVGASRVAVHGSTVHVSTSGRVVVVVLISTAATLTAVDIDAERVENAC